MVDLDSLETDLKTLNVPVEWGDVVTDWDALIRVVNAVPELVALLRLALLRGLRPQ